VGDDRQVAVVVGVGPGLGLALVRRFAAGGMAVAAAARDEDRLAALVGPAGAHAYGCDASSEQAVEHLFERVTRELGPPALVVFNAGAYLPKTVVETTPEEFERCWRILCFGGFLVGRAAAGGMIERGQGTILFTGATAALRGGARFVNLAVGKFGLRALAQSLARELGPRGVHVAHIVVDGQIGAAGDDRMLRPEAIAEAYWQLHVQPRSAWTQELDLRPWAEKF
jgi:NAD(P)-dependent dehydrogenase (short-subunit alcohol dehydrogenase family)